MINNNADISILSIFPRGSQKAHTSSEEDWNYFGKNCQKLGYFCITKIRLGEILLKKKV